MQILDKQDGHRAPLIGRGRNALHPFHSLGLFLLAAVIAILPLAAARSAEFRLQAGSQINPKTTGESATRAKKVFESICAGCHGLDGRGGERGPNIATSQDARRLSDAELFKILQQGKPSRGMPAFNSLGTQTLNQLRAYLRILQGSRGKEALTGNPERGKTLFFGKAGCSECHMIGGSGGFLGSDLSGYANGRPAPEIRDAILNVNKDPDPHSRVLIVTLLDSRAITGIARNEDNFTLQLQSFDGTFHFLHKADVARIDMQTHTPMPSGYESLLSVTELDDLVGYLLQVGTTNPGSPAKNRDEPSVEDNE